jgi:hypothetical protein
MNNDQTSAHHVHHRRGGAARDHLKCFTFLSLKYNCDWPHLLLHQFSDNLQVLIEAQ